MLPAKIHISAEIYGLQLKVQENNVELLLPTVKKQKNKGYIYFHNLS